MISTFDSIESTKAIKKKDLQSDILGCTDINIITDVLLCLVTFSVPALFAGY